MFACWKPGGRFDSLRGSKGCCYALSFVCSTHAVLQTECKKQSDLVWLAGALEGCCTSQLLLGKDDAESIEGFKDALLHYNKVIWFQFL